jgi:UDP-2-acetamido-3-amino-2,3-dideoxy-glucuronate N-acetyltransferase
MTTLRYPDNVMCHNYVSWLHPFKEHRIIVIGNKGMLRFDDSPNKGALVFYEKGIDLIDGEPIKRDGPTEQIAYGNGAPLTEELRYFAENLDGTIARADAKNAIEVLEILERATTSLQKENNDSTQKTGGATSAAPRQNIAPSATLGTNVKVHDSAYVDDDVVIGDGTKIWHYSHVQSGTTIGRNCSLGQNINVGNDVKIGNHVLIQNNVSVYHGVELEDYVFCGPSMTFTNVLDPRAKYPQGSSAYSKTLIKEGTSIGANATIVCGNTIGRHVFVAAGAVVTKAVPDYAFMIGVPARRQGWVTEGGERVPDDHVGIYKCSKSGFRYEIRDGSLTPVS